ncbi:MULTISPECIES: DUF3299 domain-containing protein [Vibrio]|uniref:DUF3299 domain-containing protein n=1 Tax=Vibrio splendidus TaxID=29497 RepID=A0A7Y4FYN0_VIBSP|nr:MULTISPECIES: DUF3299 domain-containing protein [Vibrio]OED63158.1 hypothetical protein A143_12130 [Vibrio splendidus ZS-139]TVU65225.1 DUF3299 domain-containing protein [Vibrio atlanticus]MCF7494402.1 DUF3299 domain-containing protein [Vibrio sp. L5-1]NOJ03122.1 DUF3299 domain-containing protein [Vibrio splendidus]NOJ06821.1 DUF3299 domain-containing protein [Vibrio splendidus]
MKNTLLMVMACCFSLFTQAAETISWESLRPVQNQYQVLSPGNKALLSEIYAYEAVQKTRQLSPMENDGYNQRVVLAEKFGLNVRELLLQRTQQANDIVPELSINDMKLAGFLVPLEMEGLIGKQFILVPTAGACIHTPPPPVNQTILVEFPEGHELQSLYTPVWVTGNIKTGAVDTSIALSDGNQDIETGYVIDASDIELYH